MVKMKVMYENDIEKIESIEALARCFKLGKIGQPHKSGKYYRVYVEIKKIIKMEE